MDIYEPLNEPFVHYMDTVLEKANMCELRGKIILVAIIHHIMVTLLRFLTKSLAKPGKQMMHEAWVNSPEV